MPENYRGQAVEFTRDGYQCRDLQVWNQETRVDCHRAIDAVFETNHSFAIAAHEEAVIANQAALAEVGKGNHAEGLAGAMARRSSKAAKEETFKTYHQQAMNWAAMANGAALNSRYAFAIENHEKAIKAHRVGIALYHDNGREDGPAPSFREDDK